MRSDAKATSAGSTSGSGKGLGYIGGSFATRGAFSDASGSGAQSVGRLATSAALLAAVALLAFLSASAHASIVHPYIGTFGSAAKPNFTLASGMAVDQSTGDLLVIDTAGVNTVSRWHTDGTPSNFSALGTNVIDAKLGTGGKPCVEEPSSCDKPPHDGFSFGGATEVQVAVDNSGGLNDGNIYVAETGRDVVDIFASSGQYLGQLTKAGATNFEYPCGVAVDPTGNVYVGDGGGKVHKFAPSANPPLNTDNTASFPLAEACTLAAGAGPTAGFLFAAEFFGTVSKLDSSTGEIKYVVAPGSNTTVSADPVSGRVYVAKGSEVVEYDATGVGSATTVSSIKLGSAVQGIAIHGAAGKVYVARVSTPNVDVFGTATVTVPDLTIDSASGITGAKATLNATVNPDNVAITECKFEYGTTTAYGSSQSCEGAIPTDATAHAVTGALTGLLANGTTYHYRIVAKNAEGESVSADKTFVTASTYFTKPASPVADTKATLNGTVKLEGVTLIDCQFEYGQFDFYGTSVPCQPHPFFIPSDSEDHAVTGLTTGLSPNTTYHFRLVAKTAAGTILGSDQTFMTQGPPQITEQSASVTGPGSASLRGHVNPKGFATNYHFEWGLDSSYGFQAPAEFDPFIGSGTTSVKVVGNLTGLEEDTTYHYRIVATNELGTTNGPEQTFTTARSNASCPNASLRGGQASAANPAGSTYLPNCMALEMVSPPSKFNQKADLPQFSPSGEAVVFTSLAALGGTGQVGNGLGGDPYVARRGPSSWTTYATQPPLTSSRFAFPCSYDVSFSRWTSLLVPSQETTIPSASSLGGSFVPLGPTLTKQESFVVPSCEGGSADAQHIFFAGTQGGFLPGDPISDDVSQGGNQYEAYRDAQGNPTAELITRDKDGKVWGGACGSQIGANNTSPLGTAKRAAISPDASRVYFSARPSQGAGTCNKTANKLRVMKRLRTPAGPVISEVSTSECTRVAPPCDTSDGDDTYRAASYEGDKVFFMTTRQLADSDLDTGTQCTWFAGFSGGCDLYLYDASAPAGARLTQISAGDAGNPTPGKGAEVLGVTDVAGDGSRAYFVARGVLTTTANARGATAEAGKPNLYLYQRDGAHPAGSTSFIGVLATSDSGIWDRGPGLNRAAAVPLLGSDVEDLSVGGDGHVLVFQSAAPLTPDDTDTRTDIYRYDSETGSLQRISKAAPGGVDNGTFDAEGLGPTFIAFQFPVPPGDLTSGRVVSEDGETIAFFTPEALDPADNDGEPTSYVWRAGKVTAIQQSTAPEAVVLGDPRRPTVSMSGEEVAFVSAARLLPEDGDNARDVYVLRAGGGYPPVIPPAPCDGEACQGAPGAQPGDQGAASESFVGPGKAPVPPSQCKKGSVRKKGKCIKKPARKRATHKKTRKRNANANRRAGK